LYLSLNPGATPTQVTNAILDDAVNGVVTDPGTGSPNRLLQSRFPSAALTVSLVTDHADPTDFPFATTGTGLSPFTLDSDPGDTTNPPFVVQHLVPGTYTITQQVLPARWHVTAITCNGLSQDLANRKATVTIGTTDVSCTFTYAEWLHFTIVQDSLP